MKDFYKKHEDLCIILCVLAATALFAGLVLWSAWERHVEEPVHEEFISEESVPDDNAYDDYASWWYYKNFILRW